NDVKRRTRVGTRGRLCNPARPTKPRTSALRKSLIPSPPPNSLERTSSPCLDTKGCQFRTFDLCFRVGLSKLWSTHEGQVALLEILDRSGGTHDDFKCSSGVGYVDAACPCCIGLDDRPTLCGLTN